MKKRIYSLLLMITIMLIMPISVLAETTGDLKVDCSQTIPLGSTVTCAIYGQTSDATGIVGGQFSVATSGAIKIVSSEKDSSWSSGEFADNKLTVYGTEQKSPAKLGTIVIGTADNASTGSTGQLTLSEIEVTAMNADGNGALEVADKNIDFTIGNASSNSSSSDSTTTSNNPKTMDTNVIIITMIVSLAACVVIIGKKKLDKISK